MPDLDIRIRIAAEGGKPSAEQINLITKEVQRAREDVALFAKQGGLGALAVGQDKIRLAQTQVESLGDQLLEVSLFANDLRVELDKIDPRIDPQGYSALSSQIIHTEAQAASLRQELSQLPRDLREQTADSVGFIGDIDSSLQAVAGTLNSFGQATGIGALSSAGKGLGLAGDIFATAEALPRLSAAAQQLQSNIVRNLPVLAAQVTANNAVAASAAATVAPLGGTAASLAALTVAAAPFIAIGAALAGGFALLSHSTQRNRAEVEALISSQESRHAALQRERELLDGLTFSGGTSQLQTLQTEFERLTRDRDALVEDLDRQFQEATNLTKLNQISGQKDFGGGIQGFLLDGLSGLADVVVSDDNPLQLLTDRINDFNNKIRETEQDIATINANLERVRQEEVILETTRELINVYTEQIDKETEYADLLRTGTVQGTEEQIQRIQDEITARQDAIQSLETLQSQTEEGTEAYREAHEALIEQTNAVDDLTERQRFLTDEVLVAAEARETEQVAIEASRESRERELQAMREASAERERIGDQIESTEEQLTDSLEDRQRVLDDRIRAETRAGEESEVLARLETAKQIDAQRAREREISQVRFEGRSKEIEIIRSGEEDIRKARDKANASINKINTDFIKSELRAIQDFNRDRQRLTEDAEQSLLEAAQRNDINAFISARTQAVTQLRRGDEDFGVTRDRAGEDRNEQINAIRQQLQEELATRREAAQQAITETRQEQQERINSIAQGGKVRVTQEQMIQQELIALRERFRNEDKELTQRREDSAFNERFQKLANHHNSLTSRLSQLDAEFAESSFAVGINAARHLLNGFNTGIMQGTQQSGGFLTRVEYQQGQRALAGAFRFAGVR